MGQLKGDYSAILTPAQQAAIIGLPVTPDKPATAMKLAFDTAHQVSGGWANGATPDVVGFSSGVTPDLGKASVAAHVGSLLLMPIENLIWSRSDIGSPAWVASLYEFYGLGPTGMPNGAGPNDFFADVVVNIFGGVKPLPVW